MKLPLKRWVKKPGNYLTLEVQGIRQQDTELQQKVERIFCKKNFLIS